MDKNVKREKSIFWLSSGKEMSEFDFKTNLLISGLSRFFTYYLSAWRNVLMYALRILFERRRLEFIFDFNLVLQRNGEEIAV